MTFFFLFLIECILLNKLENDPQTLQKYTITRDVKGTPIHFKFFRSQKCELQSKKPLLVVSISV